MVFWVEHEVATLPVAAAATGVGLYARAAAAFDLVRVSAYPPDSITL